MTKILTSSAVSTQLQNELREWLEKEWGEVDSFAGNHAGLTIPGPIVAVDPGGTLLGGLAFSSFAKPDQTPDKTNPDKAMIGVWINALLVSPCQRGKGIASELVDAAQAEAERLGVAELFVLSEFPKLYQKLGWVIVDVDSETADAVLYRNLR